MRYVTSSLKEAILVVLASMALQSTSPLSLLLDFIRVYSHLQLINFGLNSPPLSWLLL
jgi:hypothetical protein